MGMIPVVVLGFHRKEILAALPNLETKSIITINPEPERGQFSSLQTGLQSIRSSSAFILPIDTPSPPPGVWTALLDHSKDHWVAIPKFKNRGGHPVWLSSDFSSQLSLGKFPSAEERLDVQIRLLDPKLVTLIEVEDSSILTDLDSPEDVHQLLKS